MVGAIIIILLLEIFAAGIVGGLFGSLTGLGGGAVVVPILSIYMGIPLYYATGASLISTIATSAGSARSYIKTGMANMRIGISLSIGTVLGAITGSLIAAYVYSQQLESVIFILFGVVLFISSYLELERLLRKKKAKRIRPDWSTRLLGLNGSYYDDVTGKRVSYRGARWHFAIIVMYLAGLLSGLLGIGAGVLKVLGMDLIIGLPIKVTTTTSNFMIGVTAATSSGIYWEHGLIQPLIVAPAAVGVLIGALIGSRLLPRISGKEIKILFIAIVVILGVQMVLRGVGIA